MTDKTKAAVALFSKFAKEYQDKFMDLSLYHDSFDLLCEQIIQKNAAVLDLACGPGNITQYLLKKRPDLRILGIDLSAQMIELARINNPSAEFKLMDCRDMSTLAARYDAIVCGFGLPYLSREEADKLISDASEMLHPEGILFLSTMEDDYSKSGMKTSPAGNTLYIHYHQADQLSEVLNRHHFSILDLRRKSYPEADGTITTDLLIIAKKQNKK